MTGPLAHIHNLQYAFYFDALKGRWSDEVHSNLAPPLFSTRQISCFVQILLDWVCVSSHFNSRICLLHSLMQVHNTGNEVGSHFLDDPAYECTLTNFGQLQLEVLVHYSDFFECQIRITDTLALILLRA